MLESQEPGRCQLKVCRFREMEQRYNIAVKTKYSWCGNWTEKLKPTVLRWFIMNLCRDVTERYK